uniref:cadherin-2-like n=1 Tax=Styela clava TaxID=7725 RepID=UPI00193A8683|nr:cadherin-2-like [Styela clava]
MYHLEYLCIITLVLCTSNVVFSKWTYPPINVNEGPKRNLPENLGQVDSSSSSVSTYGLTGAGVTSGKFDMISSTGMIRQLMELDRETQNNYTLTLSAYDSLGNSVEDPLEIHIVVLDINDNVPLFKESSLIGSVPESNDVSSGSFMTVQATDADEKVKTFNAEVRYSIVDGSDIPPSSSSRFSIDAVSGAVSVIGGLDYETTQQVFFQVVARDGGDSEQPSNLRTTSTVTVNVQDSNDNAPVFSPDPSDRSFSELSQVDTALYNIYAEDADQGVNKKTSFRFINGNIGDTFKIVSFPADDAKSRGELQLAKPLDFESGSTQYELTIQAYNEDADNSGVYVDTAKIIVKVIDENEPPVFINTPYVANVAEEAGLPNEEAQPVIQVTAEDYDFNRNQTVSYSVNDPQGWFQINSEDGQVSRIGVIDREASVVKNGVYTLIVVATDNYDHGTPKSRNGEVAVHISDINDNPPEITLSAADQNVIICEEPQNSTVLEIPAQDPDSTVNGPPFTFLFDSTVDDSRWEFATVSSTTSKIVALFTDYNLQGAQEVVQLPFTITDSGSPSQTGSATVTVTICTCNSEGRPSCAGAAAAAFPVAIIIAIIAILLLIIILIFALVAYKRRQAAMVLKEPFFDDEDDVRENVQVYQEEGGEEDQDAYDLTALRAPLLEDPNQPVRIEKPLQQAPRQPRGVPDDIGDYIGDAKDQADTDPSAPPFDSLLVFDYEGAGSDAGSLSSINTATTDGSADYDYLNNWGPRFKKLANMYNDGSDSE